MTPGQPCPCPPEFETIAATYGAPPIQAYWVPNFNVFPPYYIDMVYSGRYQVANVLGSLPPGDVNLIAHSHGGNVAIMATYLAPRRLRHLINLATPINWDLPGLLGGGADSRCQISSTADWVQFAGASPTQVLNFAYAIYYAIRGAIEAFQALLAGDYVAAYEYFSRSVFEVIEAEYWWLTTKVEVEGPTYMFTGLGHSDLHEPPVWNAIRNVCATN
jgi:pimeloyl-ACP methyl ester carboxylesterase